jgi:hypothetical protein
MAGLERGYSFPTPFRSLYQWLCYGKKPDLAFRAQSTGEIEELRRGSLERQDYRTGWAELLEYGEHECYEMGL